MILDVDFLDWEQYWHRNRYGRAFPYLPGDMERNPEIKKLNMGCGSLVYSPENGWHNMDYNSGPGIIQHDWYNIPWPFEDDYFDYLFMSNCLEHICPLRWFDIMGELFRITKNGGLWEIHGPEPDNVDITLQAPSHTGLVGPWSFFGYVHRETKGDLNLAQMSDKYRLVPIDCEYSDSRPTKWIIHYGAHIGGINDYHFRKYLGRRFGEIVAKALGRPWTLRLVYRVIK